MPAGSSRVLSLQQDLSRPVCSLERSPHLAGVVLSVSEWRFSLWREGHSRPLMRSPPGEKPYTCGCLSPSRAGVVILGR